MPVDAVTVLLTPVLFTAQRTGATRIGIPCALFVFQRWSSLYNSDALRRENAVFCSDVIAKQRVARTRADDRLRKIPWGWIAAESDARLRLLNITLETTMLHDHLALDDRYPHTVWAIFVSLELAVRSGADVAVSWQREKMSQYSLTARHRRIVGRFATSTQAKERTDRIIRSSPFMSRP